MAAQEFQHLSQEVNESVSEFIIKLERTFRTAYRKSRMTLESKEALLHGQMQEGLLLKSCSVWSIWTMLSSQK